MGHGPWPSSRLCAEKIDETCYALCRCYVGGLNFLSFRVEPVLTVSVIVGERGPTVRLLETEVPVSSCCLPHADGPLSRLHRGLLAASDCADVPCPSCGACFWSWARASEDAHASVLHFDRCR